MQTYLHKGLFHGYEDHGILSKLKVNHHGEIRIKPATRKFPRKNQAF
jgi:hypothetical protein